MKSVSIIIPVYNEKETVLQLLDAVKNADTFNLKKEIILVDDCSRDGTRDVLENIKEDNIRCFYHEENQGKGAALRTGFSQAGGDIILIQDADLEYNPQEYVRLLKPILDGKADVVYGSRFKGGAAGRVLYFWHSIGNRFLTLLSNMFTNLNLTDMETCYKVFKKDILARIEVKENRFGFEPEITAKIAKIKRVRIYEVGISYAGRTYEEGKKINWRDGVAAIYCILKYNLFS